MHDNEKLHETAAMISGLDGGQARLALQILAHRNDRSRRLADKVIAAAMTLTAHLDRIRPEEAGDA